VSQRSAKSPAFISANANEIVLLTRIPRMKLHFWVH
jgi:hypothetical protein